jgi:hypothetical protein
MTPAIVSGLPDICTGFPALPEPLISRPHFLDTIATMFDGATQLVVIEGQEGLGKTTLAAQFARRNETRAISLFVSDVSAFSRSPEYLLTILCDQIHWRFHGIRMSPEVSPEVYVGTARLRLQREAVSQGQPFYFVIDGLLQVADLDPGLVGLVLTDYLSAGIPGFKFLVTGDSSKLPEKLREKVKFKPWTPPGFSPAETRLLLDEFGLSASALTDIGNTFGGVPGKITSVRRSLQSGLSAAELERDLPKGLKGLFLIEWRAVDSGNELQVTVLALLAFSLHQMTLESISRIVGSDPSSVLDTVSRLGFIRITPGTLDPELSYASNSFREFAASQLSTHRKRCVESIVNLLLSESPTPATVEHLPSYLESLGRHKDLVSYLSLDHLAVICENMHSLQPLAQVLRRGFEASKAVASPATILQFAFELSIVSEVGAASVLSSEVEAHLAIGEYTRALTIAQGAFLKEDRLEGLATIVHTVAKKGEKPDPAILAEIQILADIVDYSTAPNRAVSIASDIIGVLPDVAIALVEKSTKEDSEYPVDVALATLTIAARDLEREQAEGGVKDESISSRIANPSVRSVARALGTVVAGYSIEELIRRCEQMESTRACLYMLERWAVNNVEHTEANRVISYALGRMLRATDFTLDAKTVRRLAAPLPHLAETGAFAANTLLQTIDAQLVMLEKNGPSVDYARLCITLAETEAAWSAEQALARFEQLGYFVANLEPELRVEALAWMISALKQDRHLRLVQIASTFLSTLESDFWCAVDQLLLGTAEHYEALKRPVRALASVDLILTIELASKANVQARRDLLLSESLSQLTSRELRAMDVTSVQSVLSQMHETSVRDDALTEMLGKLDGKDIDNLSEGWTGIFKRVLSIQRAPWKVIGCALAQAVCARQSDPAFANLAPILTEHLDTAIQAVNSDWDRTDLGFTIANILGDSNLTRTHSLIQAAHDTRKRSLVPDGRTATAYIQAARLAIRAFMGLLPRQLDVDEAYTRLRRIINHLPSDGERIRLWSELALRCFAVMSKDLGSRIVNEEIRTIVRNIADQGFYSFIMADTAPALYYAHSASAVRDLLQLDEPHRNEAFENICWYILHRIPLHDPTGSRFIAKLTANDVEDFLHCLKHIQDDSSLSYYVQQLTDALMSSEGQQEFSRANRAEIARRVQELTKGKFPWQHGIAHQGYSVVVAACVTALEGSSLDSWKQVAENAKAIPNFADRTLVLGIIAHFAPSRFDSFRVELINEARASASSISAPLDRLERLRYLAEWAEPFDINVARTCLTEAFRLSVDVKRDVTSQQRAMVDFANRISDEFAKSLISQLDDDPAIRKRKRLKQRSELNTVLRKLPKNLSEETIAHLSDRDTAELCGMMLTGLHDGSVAYIPVDKVRIFMARITSLPFRESYTAIAWAIENSTVQHSHTPYGTSHLLETFGACATACELGMQLMSRSVGYQSGLSDSIVDSEQVQLIEPGERMKAIGAISDWIRGQEPTVLKLCDPFFGPVDLELLKLVLEIAPSCTVQIFAGEKKQLDLKLEAPFDVAYLDHWKTISQNDPPQTDLVVAGLSSSRECPIHERWIFASGAGLRLGSSISGLGRSRVTEVSTMTSTEAATNEALLDGYLSCRVRDNNGDRVRYFRSSFG